MSHYSVTVVLDGAKAEEVMSRGETLDGLLTEALAPFDEDIQVDPYPNETYTWDEGEAPFGADGEAKRPGLYVTDEVHAANSWEAVYLEYREEYGDSMVQFDPEARKMVVLTQYNPQSKWDWWTIGGRWSNYFRSKDRSAGVNYVLVQYLDTDAMIGASLVKRMGKYDDIRKIVGDCEHVSWSWHVDKVDAGEWSVEEARAAYHAQESVRALRTASQQNHDYAFESLEEYMVPREVYEEQVRNAAVPTYALLGKDGVWSEPGRMMMFGMSDETDATKAEFQKLYMEYLAGLNPLDVLVCVDVHI